MTDITAPSNDDAMRLAALTAMVDQIHGLVDHSPELSSVEVVMKIQQILDRAIANRPDTNHHRRSLTMNTDQPERYTSIHAKVRFKQDHEYRGGKSGVTELIPAGTVIDPLQIKMTGPTLDPTSPDAIWVDEVQSSGVCMDWVEIPGSVLEVLDHWRV